MFVTGCVWDPVASDIGTILFLNAPKWDFLKKKFTFTQSLIIYLLMWISYKQSKRNK